MVKWKKKCGVDHQIVKLTYINLTLCEFDQIDMNPQNMPHLQCLTLLFVTLIPCHLIPPLSTVMGNHTSYSWEAEGKFSQSISVSQMSKTNLIFSSDDILSDPSLSVAFSL